MKRHPALQPLSRDHHPALVQAKRLIGFSGDGDRARAAAESFITFWDEAITPHFREEEEWLLPLVALRVGEEAEEIRETLRQHVVLRRQVMGLRLALQRGEPPAAIDLNALGEALRAHVRFEEEQLFPAAEAALGEEEWAALAEWLAA
ncbi:MAG: hypothetical protein Kow006_17830 [Gammaproteobacteria bacterium]